MCCVLCSGFETDYVIVGSDSGRIVVLSFDNQKNRFVKVRATNIDNDHDDDDDAVRWRWKTIN